MRKLAVLLALVPAILPLPANASGPAYVTLSFGRTNWQAMSVCKPMANTITLGQVAADLAIRGYEGTGILITSRTGEADRLCTENIVQYASWADVEQLASQGWSFVDGGTHDQDVSSMTFDQASAEICGSKQVFYDHGIDPTGMWGWANNKYIDPYQRSIVSTCFDWGRLYNHTLNTPAINQPPFTQRTWSVSGGYCASRRGPCYTNSGAPQAYQSPDRLMSYVNGASDTWAVLQAYRFVTGSKPSGASRWDCTGSVDQHWTSRVELYCYGDYLAIVDAIPSSAVVTDPATVAAAWGRSV